MFDCEKSDDANEIGTPIALAVEVTAPQALVASREIARLTSGLDCADPADLSDSQIANHIEQWDRLIRWAQGRQVVLVGELMERANQEKRRTQVEPEIVAGEEVSTALALSSREGVERARVASSLCQILWETHEALLAGIIDYPKAALLASELREHSPEVAFAVEDAVLPYAARCSRAQLKSKIAKSLIEIDPVDADARFVSARERRRINRPRPLANGMASIYMVMPADDAMAVESCVNAAARSRKAAGDARTFDQLRVDSIAAMAHHALALGGIGVREIRVRDVGVQTTGAQETGVQEARAGKAKDVDAEGAADSSVEVNIHAARTTNTWTVGTTTFFENQRPADPWPSHSPASGVFIKATNSIWSIRYLYWDAFAVPKSVSPLLGTRRHGPIEVFNWGRTLRASTAVSVTVPLDWLTDHAGIAALDWPQIKPLGYEDDLENEESSEAESPPRVGEPKLLGTATLMGYGPIPPALAGALAMEPGSVWRRIVTDPLSGAVLDVGRATYRPSSGLARHVIARDGYCVAPRCQVRATACDLDHSVPFAQDGRHDDALSGGTTSADNLAPLCRRHHRLKTLAGWDLIQTSPGRFVWVTPSGRREASASCGVAERDLVEENSVRDSAAGDGAVGDTAVEEENTGDAPDGCAEVGGAVYDEPV